MKLQAFVCDRLASLRDLLSVALRDRGYEVTGSTEPVFCPIYGDGRETCPRPQPCADLLIIDNQLPAMTGLELIEKLQHGGCGILPRNEAVMAAEWPPEAIEKARVLGCKTFRKPFRFREFSRWLDDCEQPAPATRQHHQTD